MASPQLENGYTKISNELLEALYKADINATQLKIIMCVARFTYGFSRKEHEISITFLSRALGTNRKYISKELNRLIERDFIKVTGNFSVTNSRTLMLNKNYNQWIGCPTKEGQSHDKRTVVQSEDTTVPQKEDTTVPQLWDQERKDKENIKKRASDHFFLELWTLYPEKKGKSKVSKKSKDQLMEIGPEKIRSAITRYVNEVEHKRQNGFPQLNFMHGSTFFNGGYEDYLEEDQQQSPYQKDDRLGVIDETIYDPEAIKAAQEKKRRWKEERENGVMSSGPY